MEFKGTKGKWFIDYANQYINEYNVLCTPISTDKVINLCEIYGDCDHTKSDALLISKAPEMLDLLQRISVSLENLWMQDDSNEVFDLIDAEELDKLIKEATEL